MTYKEFKAKMRADLWPFPGEAKSLVGVHDSWFQEAMMDLQAWVPCLQQNNTTVWPACSTMTECGKTVVDAPRGVIGRIYTVVGDEQHCDKVFYRSAPFGRLESWSRNLLNFTEPVNAGLPKFQQGFRAADKTSDSTCGRARTGIWAIYRNRLYCAPWLQSNERLIVEWDGVKQEWLDTDTMDIDVWGAAEREAIKDYVEQKQEQKFGCGDRKAPAWANQYNDKLADLMFSCREATRQQSNEDIDVGAETSRIPTKAELDDDTVVTPTDSQVFAVIGDFGDPAQAATDVCNEVKAWGPAYIVTVGDNWYGTTTDISELDQLVGSRFSDYISPYFGSYGNGAGGQLFFPAVGNHDRDPVGRLDVWKKYFSQPRSYYDFVQGHVHWFMLDAGYDNSQIVRQPDGVTATSVQAMWLKAMLAVSVARWKIVVMHQQPYSSTAIAANVEASMGTSVFPGDGTLSYVQLRWPYGAWGADLVLNGHSHNYEHLRVAGLDYLCAGFGGKELKGFHAPPSPYSIFRDAADYGALRGTVSCDTLKFEAISRVGEVLETVQLTKKSAILA